MDKKFFWAFGTVIFLLLILIIILSLNEDDLVVQQGEEEVPETWVEGRCALIGELRCAEAILDKAGYLSLKLVSNKDLLITRVQVISEPDSRIFCDDEETNIELLSSSKVITLSCGDASIGDLDAELNIYFTELDSGISKLLQGNLINIQAFN